MGHGEILCRSSHALDLIVAYSAGQGLCCRPMRCHDSCVIARSPTFARCFAELWNPWQNVLIPTSVSEDQAKQKYPRRLEDSEALSASSGAAEVVRVTLQTNCGSACGPVIVPVFKTGGRHLRCRRCVRLTHASAKTEGPDHTCRSSSASERLGFRTGDLNQFRQHVSVVVCLAGSPEAKINLAEQ